MEIRQLGILDQSTVMTVEEGCKYDVKHQFSFSYPGILTKIPELYGQYLY